MALHLIIFLPFQCLEKIRVFAYLIFVISFTQAKFLENKIYTGAARGARDKYEVCVLVELFRVVTDFYLGLSDNTRALQYLFGIEKNVCHTILLGNTLNALSNPLLCTVHSLGSLVMTGRARAGKDWFEKMAFQCSLLHSVHIP